MQNQIKNLRLRYLKKVKIGLLIHFYLKINVNNVAKFAKMMGILYKINYVFSILITNVGTVIIL